MSDWDILNLPDDEWYHIQILDRLHAEGIDCFFADIWLDDIAYLVGCHPGPYSATYNIANALNVPSECVYFDGEHGFAIINLYQVKAIRSGFDKKIEEYGEKYGFGESSQE